MFLTDGGHTRGDPGVDGTQHKSDFIPGDQLFGNLGRVIFIQGRVARHENDLATQDTAPGVEFIDRHLGATTIGFRMQGKTSGGGRNMGNNNRGMLSAKRIADYCQPG
jgi:hypothetical protein